MQVKEGHSLVRTGPYRYSRHPIYTGILFSFLGTAAFLDRWLEFPGFALVAIGFAQKLKREEGFMEQEFGDAYQNYRAKVRMLIPFIW